MSCHDFAFFKRTLRERRIYRCYGPYAAWRYEWMGTITRTVFDALGRPVETWVGTNDTGWSPASPGTNMTKVSENQYDNGGVGDSLLTQVTLFPDGIADNLPGSTLADRVTRTKYDWRDRPVVSISGAASDHPPLTLNSYDNLDRVVSTQIYDGTTVSFAAIDPNAPVIAASARRAFSEAMFDDRGRVYRTLQYNIDQNSGASLGSLATDTWYDNRDQAIKTRREGLKGT